MICEPLQHQFTSQAQQSYDHLRDLNLADCSTGEVRRGENGPTAVGTRLGWVLSGPVEDERMPISKLATNLATTHVLRCATSPNPEPFVFFENNIYEVKIKFNWLADAGKFHMSANLWPTKGENPAMSN
jgi:hypothetical protein